MNIIKWIFILLILVLISCTSKKKNAELNNNHTGLTFERIDSLEPADTKIKLKRDKRYIVHGFRKSEKNYATIDSFVCENIDSSIYKHRDYHISFFRFSKKTNNKYFKKVPRDFYRYSSNHDYICSYWWREGKFFSKTIYPTFYIYEAIDIDSLVCQDTIYRFL